MSSSTWFPNPPIPYAVFQAQITEYSVAHAACSTHAKGATITRDAKRAAATATVSQYEAYVQSVADAHLDQAETIIVASGLSVAQTGARAPQGFTAKNLASGEVYVTAPAGAYSVNWRYSVDGGKTWVDAGQTGVAHTTITDLTPGILTLFCNQRVLASTVEAWSDPISLMVT